MVYIIVRYVYFTTSSHFHLIGEIMNFGSLALKAVVIIVLLFLLSLAGAITFPLFSVMTGTGAGLASLLFLLLAMIVLSVIGNLIGRGIRSVKKPMEALVLTFVGSFFMGAALAIFLILKIPFTPNININWLGTAWYSPLLTFLFVGAPLMMVFLVTD
jgi:hypothetical protein